MSASAQPTLLEKIAAVATPLIPTITTELISLITGLVHKAAPIAQAANPVPGTGAVRFADVFASVMQAVIGAHAAGQITGALPDESIVKVVIQAVVTSMKLPGNILDMTGVAPLAAVAAVASVAVTGAVQSVVLKAGQTLSITVGA
jgi:hypothetical protein